MMRAKQWLAEREPEWQRLEGLLDRSGTRLTNLSPGEIRDLGLLYRAVINDLSRVRSVGDHAHLEPYLNSLAQRCHSRVYTSPPARARDIALSPAPIWRTVRSESAGRRRCPPASHRNVQVSSSSFTVSPRRSFPSRRLVSAASTIDAAVARSRRAAKRCFISLAASSRFSRAWSRCLPTRRSVPATSTKLQLPKPKLRPVESIRRLTAREREILQLVVEGQSSADIARQLHLSPKTVETYRSRLMDKLEVGDVTALVKFAVQHGITPLE